VTLKWVAAVSRGIPRICRGEPRNLANGAAEFGKICRGKLWSLIIIISVKINVALSENASRTRFVDWVCHIGTLTLCIEVVA